MTTTRESLTMPALTELARAEQEMKTLRARMAASMSRVREDVRLLTDFRRPIRDRPWTWLGVAFGLGFLFATTHRREIP